MTIKWKNKSYTNTIVIHTPDLRLHIENDYPSISFKAKRIRKICSQLENIT